MKRGISLPFHGLSPVRRSGPANGVIDLYAYEQYLSGALKDYTPTDAEIRRSLDRIA